MNKEKLKNEIEKTKEEIKSKEQTLHELEDELEKKEGRWKPEAGERYWYLGWDGSVDWVYYSYLGACEKMLFIGNYFKTKEEAEFMVEKLKVIEELKEFAFKPDWEDDEQVKWYLFYNHYWSEIDTLRAYKNEEINNIYFATEEDCRKAIETVGEDRIKKYLFGKIQNT